MNDYGEMFYGTLPPDTQDFRQVLAGIGRTIRERATTAGQRIVESAREARALQDQAFGDPTRPTRVTDEAALRRLTDMIMAGPLGFAPAGITAYHGSPYLFRMFDPAKVGTGEGAQAYGVGSGYTAEARPVAQRYAEILANRDIANQNRLNPHANAKRLVDLAGDPKYAADDIRFALESNPDNPQKELLSKTLDYIESGKYAEPLQTSGYLYKGDIPDEILSKFLDWDKPIKKQPNVMAALRSEAEQRVRSQKLVEIENEIRGSIPSSNFGDDYLSMFRDVNVSVNQNIQKQAIEKLNKMDLSSLIEKELEAMKPRDINWNMTGKDLYEFLAKNQGSAEQATMLLDRNGVRGIRYLDQASRGEGKGTSNFIPFRPEDFKIQEINDIPIQQYIDQGLL